jgi:hypothetical protein
MEQQHGFNSSWGDPNENPAIDEWTPTLNEDGEELSPWDEDWEDGEDEDEDGFGEWLGDIDNNSECTCPTEFEDHSNGVSV